jgi:hypothetical protein
MEGGKNPPSFPPLLQLIGGVRSSGSSVYFMIYIKVIKKREERGSMTLSVGLKT